MKPQQRRPTPKGLLCERLKKVKPSNSKTRSRASNGSNMKPQMRVTNGKMKSCLEGGEKPSRCNVAEVGRDRWTSSSGFRGDSDRGHAPKVRKTSQRSRVREIPASTVVPQVTILSPTRAARVQMLKTRYAKTIAKAQQALYDCNGDVAKKHLTEQGNRKIEEKRADKEMIKKSIEEQRRAARAALERVERSVYFDDGQWIQEQFELLCGRSFDGGQLA